MSDPFPARQDGGVVVEEARPKVKQPPLYQVVLLNDDYTPMEFVVDVLEKFFSLDRPNATRIMLEVHTKGKGVCGVFTYEIAETKVAQVTTYALEYCLNDAFHQAREARREYLTVEHLLLAILDTPKVREVLRACGADLSKLKQELKDHIDQSTPRLEEGEEREAQPTLGFQRVLQRAVFHVQSSGKKEVGVSNVLVAIFSEKQSHRVFLLHPTHARHL